jgi:hypothetical protein
MSEYPLSSTEKKSEQQRWQEKHRSDLPNARPRVILRLTLISPANGARVVLCARRMERLQTIAAEDIDVNEIVVRPLATQV